VRDRLRNGGIGVASLSRKAFSKRSAKVSLHRWGEIEQITAVHQQQGESACVVGVRISDLHAKAVSNE
jgi:hypothetical protein